MINADLIERLRNAATFGTCLEAADALELADKRIAEEREQHDIMMERGAEKLAEAECRGVPDYVWMIGTKGFMALFATEEAANDWQQMNGTNTPASYIQPVSIPVISAAPKPDPERKHEIVPTLAEPSEYAKAFQDMITHGCPFMKDGMRIPPEDVIEPAEPDCECGAVASEHCPACEPVAQEPVAFMNSQGKPVSADWIKHHAQIGENK